MGLRERERMLAHVRAQEAGRHVSSREEESMGDVDGPLTGVKDAEIDRLLDDYRRVNNDEDLTAAEQEEALSEIAAGIRERQAKLMEEEGHTGIG